METKIIEGWLAQPDSKRIEVCSDNTRRNCEKIKSCVDGINAKEGELFYTQCRKVRVTIEEVKG